MAQPSTRSELITYAKRQLGAPVLEINVADEQVEDILDDAIQYFPFFAVFGMQPQSGTFLQFVLLLQLSFETTQLLLESSCGEIITVH